MTKIVLVGLGMCALVGIGALAVASITPAPPARADASLEVISIPSGARVSIDGRDMGASPIKVDHIPVGKPLTLRIELDRHEPWQRIEPVQDATDLKVIASLRPVLGALRVESKPPGAEVFLGSRSLGLTPLARSDMDPFTDGTIEVRKQGHRPSRQPLVWNGQRETTLSFELQPAPSD